MIKLNVLKEMYRTHSPSKFEEGMVEIVKRELDNLGIFYYTKGNNIYRFLPDTPLLSAHMDQVGDTPTTKIIHSKGIITGDSNIGADDKNGCWIVLNLLKMFPETSFIFSEQEECGGGIADLLKIYKDELSTIKYGLVFDRKGSDDIICERNNYGTKEFEDDLCKIGEKHNYSKAWGVWSDADQLNKYFSCANLSCGYYAPHTDNEYTIVKYLYGAYNYGVDILKNLHDHYKKPEITYRSKWSNKYYYSNYKNDYSEYFDYGWKKTDYADSDYDDTSLDGFKKVKYCKKCEKILSNEDCWGGLCIDCDTKIEKHYIYHCDTCTIDFIDDEVDDMYTCPICSGILYQFDDSEGDFWDIDENYDNCEIQICPKCYEPLRGEKDMFSHNDGITIKYYCYFCTTNIRTEFINLDEEEDKKEEHFPIVAINNDILTKFKNICPYCDEKLVLEYKNDSICERYYCNECKFLLETIPIIKDSGDSKKKQITLDN